MSAFDKYQQRGLDYDAQVAASREHEKTLEFSQELSALLNRYSMENASGTPDFILAEFLVQQLQIWNMMTYRRANWRGESVELPALQKLPDDAAPKEETDAAE